MALDVNKFAQAIRQTESGGNQAALGDSGRALGAFQFHPSAFWQWMDKPGLRTTWDSWFADACMRFAIAMIAAYPGIPVEEIAVVYHQHCYIRRADPADFTADDYVTKFKAAWGKLNGA